MNRSKAPKTAGKIAIGRIDHQVISLGNSVPVHLIQAGTQQVVRIDMVFRAGSWWQPRKLVASATNAMLSEGTEKNTGEEIANKLDYYGAYLNSSADRDNASVSLYSLSKDVEKVLPLLAEIIKAPTFPETEFQTYLKRRMQNFMTEKSKVSNLALEKFSQALYGPVHPYGQVLTTSDFGKIKSEDLRVFHKEYYSSGNCSIVVTGRYEESDIVKYLDDLFGGTDWPADMSVKKEKKAIRRPSSKRDILISKKDAVQSAVRIGRELFGRKHPDYFGMLVLNNILGGHFGSRLMQNIREKKGYTYGIGSAMVGLRNSGFLVIVSEVGTGYRKAAVKEIYRELDKLCNRPVSKKELDLTRSQMLGEVLRNFDGPFSWSESIKELVEYDLDSDFYQRMTGVINTIDQAQLLDLARKYLSPEEMYEVVAGS